MGFWRRLFHTRSAPTSGQEWIAVHFKLSGGKFGTTDERDMAHAFSDKLASVIEESQAGIFDGDEFGAGEGVFFMYGPDANRLFDVVYPLLKTWEPLRGGYAIKRYGRRDNSERVEFQ
jgi:hypothetical protein